MVWAEAGKTETFSRTVSGLTNIWKYSLKDKVSTQVTSGRDRTLRPCQTREEKQFTS